jgi:hypothetical protein
MLHTGNFIQSIFNSAFTDFDTFALQAFYYQYDNNIIYNQYCKLNKILDKQSITKVAQIPFLPIQLFKSHQILSTQNEPQIVFTSSSTTGQGTSKHYVTDVNIYIQSFSESFSQMYGSIKDYCFLALLPSYLERSGSSLIYMCNELIKKSEHPLSNFYLNNHQELKKTLEHLKSKQQKTILLGATFGLLDFIETYSISFPELIVIETGGMKGRRKEITRMEAHSMLQNGFQLSGIHSEYGMTELLSQAYSAENGLFNCPKWMQISISDTTDPFTFLKSYKTGIINIIDLANIHSCCFIQTQDLGRKTDSESFEVLGRLDNSDIRGCSLLTI